jgi:hypothetical protein
MKPDLKPARPELRRFMAAIGKAMPSARPGGDWDKLRLAYRHARWLLDTYGDGRDKGLAAKDAKIKA